jgi:hypothetical protein
MPGTRIGFFVAKSIDTSKQLQVLRVNSSFYYRVIYSGKVKFGGASQTLQAQTLRLQLLFFAVQSTIECTVLYCASDSAASLKVLFRSRVNTV